MAIYLAYKEIWRNKGRYLLLSVVVALITLLVLFIAALATGLPIRTTQFISQLNADLVVYKQNANLSIPSSRIRLAEVNDVKQVAGITQAGAVGFTSATIAQKYLVDADAEEPLDISLIGLEPDRPGEPPLVRGQYFESQSDDQALIDVNVARQTGLEVGDTLRLATVQGPEQEVHELRVVGISTAQYYLFNPSVIVPFLTWDRIRPRGQATYEQNNLSANLVAVRLANPGNKAEVSQRLAATLPDMEAVDLATAYQSTPGYQVRQNVLGMQRFFSLLIGLLVIGGFFQIQILQKIPQLGMLKAIGVSNRVVLLTSMAQIIMVTIIGIVLGGLATGLLALVLPDDVPAIFTVESVALAVASLLVIGPLGGLVSVRMALRVEPLTALGLSQ